MQIKHTYTWSVNGAIYTLSGTYSVTITNAAGCPNVETLVLTINKSTANTTTATACDTYTWSVNGKTYTSSGTYSATITNAAGCPDVETLVLTINKTPAAPTASVTTLPNCTTANGVLTIAAPTGTGMTYSIDGTTYTNTSGVFTGISVKTYSVSAKNAGCTSSPTSVIVKSASSTLAATAIVGTKILCNGGTTTVTVSATHG